jgi:hypothetical protein
VMQPSSFFSFPVATLVLLSWLVVEELIEPFELELLGVVVS